MCTCAKTLIKFVRLCNIFHIENALSLKCLKLPNIINMLLSAKLLILESCVTTQNQNKNKLYKLLQNICSDWSTPRPLPRKKEYKKLTQRNLPI